MRCYACHGEDGAHVKGCALWKPKPGVEAPGGMFPSEAPRVKMSPQEAQRLWDAFPPPRQMFAKPERKVMRGALPLSGSFRVNPVEPYLEERFAENLDWIPIESGQTVVQTFYPDVEFLAEKLFVLSDAGYTTYDVVVTAIYFGSVSLLLGMGTLPIEAFPILCWKGCEVCGAKEVAERPQISFPSLTPAQRGSIYFRNNSSYTRMIKAWFEGVYAF